MPTDIIRQRLGLPKELKPRGSVERVQADDTDRRSQTPDEHDTTSYDDRDIEGSESNNSDDARRSRTSSQSPNYSFDPYADEDDPYSGSVTWEHRPSRIASETAPKSHSQSGSANPFSYDDIQTPQVTCTDPEVVEMLDAIRERLTTASTLRSRRELVDLAYDLDVPLAKRDSMPRMVQKILKSLAARDAEDIAIALNRVKEADRGSTESFMELASFITRDSRSN